MSWPSNSPFRGSVCLGAGMRNGSAGQTVTVPEGNLGFRVRLTAGTVTATGEDCDFGGPQSMGFGFAPPFAGARFPAIAIAGDASTSFTVFWITG